MESRAKLIAKLMYPTHGSELGGGIALSNSMIRCSRCGLYWPIPEIPAYRWIEKTFGRIPPIGCNRCVRTRVI